MEHISSSMKISGNKEEENWISGTDGIETLACTAKQF